MKIIAAISFIVILGIGAVQAYPLYVDGVIMIEGFNAPASTVAPTDFNLVNLSTTVLQKADSSDDDGEAGWDSIDEFRACAVDKQALLRKIKRLRRFINEMQDEDGNAAPPAQRLPYIQRLQWLVSYYKSLP